MIELIVLLLTAELTKTKAQLPDVKFRPIVSNVPVKIILTKQLSFTGKAFISECTFAVVAMDTLYMPDAIQNLQKKFIGDGQFTSRALLNHFADLCLHEAKKTRSFLSFPHLVRVYIRLCKVWCREREIYASNSSTCPVGGALHYASCLTGR